MCSLQHFAMMTHVVHEYQENSHFPGYWTIFKDVNDALEHYKEYIVTERSECVWYFSAIINKEGCQDENGIDAFNQVEEVISNNDLYDFLVGFNLNHLHRFPNQEFQEAWKNLCCHVKTDDSVPLTKEKFDVNYWFCHHCDTLLDELHTITVMCNEHKPYSQSFVTCPSCAKPKKYCKVCNMYDPVAHYSVHEVMHYTR